VPVAADGSNLPHGGVNDGRYWLEDLPEDEHLREKVRPEGRPCQREGIRAGEADAPPCMWFFCPFNGPTRARIIPFFEEHPLWPDRRARRLLGAPHAAGKQLHQGAPPDAQRRRLVDTSQLEYLDGQGSVACTHSTPGQGWCCRRPGFRGLGYGTTATRGTGSTPAAPIGARWCQREYLGARVVRVQAPVGAKGRVQHPARAQQSCAVVALCVVGAGAAREESVRRGRGDGAQEAWQLGNADGGTNQDDALRRNGKNACYAGCSYKSNTRNAGYAKKI
jgi:hypothetical protein